jgi:hypothetical protein
MTTNRIPLDPELAHFYSRYFTEKLHCSNGFRVPQWTLEIQGQRLTLKRPHEHVRRPGSRKGKKIGPFSKQARFRMMKQVAGIDWPNVGPSLFMTLTYPDDVAHLDKDKRNREKYLMLRHMENHLRKRICGLWRVEYVPRKSGTRLGKILPHIHMLLFGVDFIDADFLREAWKCCIGSVDLPRVHVERSLDGLGATKYIAKYCGKVEDVSINLVKVTYLNSGRHWGYHRKRNVPLSLKLEFPLFDPRIIHWIRIQAGKTLKRLDLDYFETFTLLGEHAAKIAEIVCSRDLDNQPSFEYPVCIKGDAGS